MGMGRDPPYSVHPSPLSTLHRVRSPTELVSFSNMTPSQSTHSKGYSIYSLRFAWRPVHAPSRTGGLAAGTATAPRNRRYRCDKQHVNMGTSVTPRGIRCKKGKLMVSCCWQLLSLCSFFEDAAPKNEENRTRQ